MRWGLVVVGAGPGRGLCGVAYCTLMSRLLLAVGFTDCRLNPPALGSLKPFEVSHLTSTLPLFCGREPRRRRRQKEREREREREGKREKVKGGGGRLWGSIHQRHLL